MKGLPNRKYTLFFIVVCFLSFCWLAQSCLVTVLELEWFPEWWVEGTIPVGMGIFSVVFGIGAAVLWTPSKDNLWGKISKLATVLGGAFVVLVGIALIYTGIRNAIFILQGNPTP
jgi:uncharacterized membrane protein YfcA